VAIHAINEIFSASEFDLKTYQGCFKISMQESAFEFVLSFFLCEKGLSVKNHTKIDTETDK